MIDYIIMPQMQPDYSASPHTPYAHGFIITGCNYAQPVGIKLHGIYFPTMPHRSSDLTASEHTPYLYIII